MRLNKNPKSLDKIFALVLKTNLCLLRLKCRFRFRQRHYSKDERCPPDDDFGNLTGIADQDITTRLHNNLDRPCFDTKWHIISFVN